MNIKRSHPRQFLQRGEPPQRTFSQLALDYAEQGLEIAPHDYKLLYNQALIYENLKRYPEALENLNTAIENCPDEVMREWIIEFQKRCQRKLSKVIKR